MFKINWFSPSPPHGFPAFELSEHHGNLAIYRSSNGLRRLLRGPRFEPSFVSYTEKKNKNGNRDVTITISMLTDSYRMKSRNFKFQLATLIMTLENKRKNGNPY